METNLQPFLEKTKPWEGMPSTRYQGSKKKLLPHLSSIFESLNFTTCLDAFGGTGSVTFLLKQLGKQVTFNDIMPCNSIMARALFSDESLKLTPLELKELFLKNPKVKYKSIVQELYNGIYFTDEENEQIDIYCQNVMLMKDAVKRSEAYYVLFQSLISKRPYNLFHRANLHMRTKDIERSFGNKVTWDKPIIDHCLKFLKEVESCRNKKSLHKVKFENTSAFSIKGDYDLVYIDTPYAKSEGTQESNYFNFYHFLDALLSYEKIRISIQTNIKHKPFYEVNKSWYPTKNIDEAFQELFKKFKKSILVISYRNDGFPSTQRMKEILEQTHKSVQIVDIAEYKYALSTQDKKTKEIAIIAKP